MLAWTGQQSRWRGALQSKKLCPNGKALKRGRCHTSMWRGLVCRYSVQPARLARICALRRHSVAEIPYLHLKAAAKCAELLNPQRSAISLIAI